MIKNNAFEKLRNWFNDFLSNFVYVLMFWANIILIALFGAVAYSVYPDTISLVGLIIIVLGSNAAIWLIYWKEQSQRNLRNSINVFGGRKHE